MFANEERPPFCLTLIATKWEPWFSLKGLKTEE